MHLDAFSGSNILNDEKQLYRALLYFNLPYETIVEAELQPHKIFEYSKDQQEKKDIGDLIEQIEQVNHESPLQSSVILLKVEHGTEEDT